MEVSTAEVSTAEGLRTQLQKSRVINVISGPGAGKSTMYSLIYAKMKIAGHSIEQVPERAKTLVWAKQFDVLDNQYHISNLQYQDLAAVYGKVSFVITDGSLLHGLYYNRYNPTNVCNIEITEKKIIELYSRFENINIFLTRGTFPYEQAGRIQNAYEATHVDTELKKILIQYGIEFREFASDEKSVEEMINYVLNQ